MKKKKKEFNEENEQSKVLWMIFFIPLIIFFIDAINLGHFFFPYMDNLTEKYDWLSFIGTYAGTIVSALFLLFITKMDRRDNNEILRTSQRPYLEVNWTILGSEFLEKNNDKLNRNLFVYNNFGKDGVYDAYNYLVLEIKNTGASVSILDVNLSNFTLEYNRYEGTTNGKDIFKREVHNIKLNKIIKRKSIAAGESMFILFNSCEFYNNREREVPNTTYISSTKIFYKDLFNYNYEDICKYNSGIIIPEKDNSLIIENKTDK